MAEMSKPIAEFLEKNQETVTDGERRTMLAIVKNNLLYMTESELRQARYLLSDAKRP